MAKKNAPAQAGQIRIIGGQWRGRKLPVPDSPGLRPTTDRVRETLFNWLAPVIQQARCLDGFAGSGALGFEALSRYAAHVTLLENERSIARQLEQNAVLLKASNARIINTNTLNWLAQAGEPYDVVFLDPPFRRDLLNQTLSLLEQQGWLAPEAWIYVETEAENGELEIPVTWTLHREKVAGQVAYRLYIRQATTTQHEEADDDLD
ncbi:16S rRNA (guanine(966)-N(2))-methyltransferase [Symbiopectobacterium purcellii]|uniref:Ribosomal RNA small subunit methyltransferase D n=1 Tax=Symbiopectobacterium purcellii TaxID=2871826 RepID=A0ABX9ALG0_9ENTR|nr:16S rRNA (guanine(966)-N(2))-methyltransferase [Symbiopectobacterium purcellii]QZN96019.1 16S rRNA (guanine(966)-N(2))-methyltransferase [Symbiopectobacterium purcellii]